MAELPIPDPDDEHLHDPGEEPLWNESWYFDWVSPDGDRGGYARAGLYPNLGVCWYWACAVAVDEPLVILIDHTVALPEREESLELKASGLSADHRVVSPLERWSLDLEGTGVLYGEAADILHTRRSDEQHDEQVAFGFGLEWETDGLAYRYPEPLDRYEIPCRVRGKVQVGGETHEVDGWGQRDHSWGVRDWWMLGHVWLSVRLEDGTRVHMSTPMLEGLDWAAGYVQRPDGDHDEVRSGVRIEESDGPEGLHGPMRVVLAGLDLTLTPAAWAPVPMDAPDGRRAVLARSMVTVRAADGRRGVGWMERNFVLDAPTPT